MPMGGVINFGVPTTPWSRAWLLHVNDAAGLTDLGFSAFTQTLVTPANRAAYLGAIGTDLEIAQTLAQDQVFDVRWFGAIGNGVADDTAAIQAAIDAAKAAGGGIVWFPIGVWRVTGTLDATGTAYVSIAGASMLYSQILYDSAVDQAVLHLGDTGGSGSHGWHRVSDLAIVGDSLVTTHGTAILWDTGNPQSVVERVFIRGMKYGLYTSSDWGAVYRDSYLSYCGTGVHLSTNPNGVQLSGLYCQRCELGITAIGAGQLTIQNCIIERKTTYSIYLSGGSSIKIDGLYTESDLAGNTCIEATRKSGYSIDTLQVSNCYFNSDSTYLIRAEGVNELRAHGNTLMTPPADQVLVLSDTSTVANGCKRAMIEGNSVGDYSGSGWDPTTKAYLCGTLGSNNPVRWDIGVNYGFTTRGVVYAGTMDQTALGVIADAWTQRVPNAAWNPTLLSAFSQDASSDALTATSHVSEGGRTVLSIVDGAGGYSASRFTQTIDLATLRAVYGATGLLRVRARCLAKNGYICLRTAGYASTKAAAGNYEVIELEWSLDVAGGPYRLGYQVADTETGYFGVLDLTVLGTDQDRQWKPRDWSDVCYALDGSITWDPASLADGAGETSGAITVTGAALGDFVIVSPPYDLQDCVAIGYVQAANTVEIRLQNESTGVRDFASGTWRVRVIRR